MKVVITQRLNHRKYGETEVVAVVNTIEDAYAYFNNKMGSNTLLKEMIEYEPDSSRNVSILAKRKNDKISQTYNINFTSMNIWTPKN